MVMAANATAGSGAIKSPEECLAVHVAEIGRGVDGLKRDFFRAGEPQQQLAVLRTVEQYCDQLIDFLSEARGVLKGRR